MARQGGQRRGGLWLLGLRPRSASAYVFAAACVAVATAVRVGLGLISPDTTIYATFYSATLVAALAGGRRAGVLAALAGGLVGYMLFIPEEWGSSPFTLGHVVSFGLYGASSAVIVWAAESYRGLVRRLEEERSTRQLLHRELAHRMKNAMATVQAVVAQTLRDHKDVRAILQARIAALAVTNNLLMQSEWHHASLRRILAAELAPYDASRVRSAGDDVDCPPTLAVYLALAIHELATNAAKHGALSSADGVIDVAWARDGDRLALHWIERGGPPLAAARRDGFGTKLLTSGVAQFDGSVSRRFEADGLRCTIALTIPAAAAVADAVADAAADVATGPDPVGPGPARRDVAAASSRRDPGPPWVPTRDIL